MVLWEITLATAYFLGLRRTYRLALKIQRRLIPQKHVKFRQFTHRRTRAAFDIALRIHRSIQERDIEVGRNLGNRILRWLDRLKPSANIRGAPQEKLPGQNNLNTSSTKQAADHYPKNPSNAQRLSTRSVEKGSGRQHFTAARNTWSTSIPSIAMMMRPPMMAGSTTQYRRLYTTGSDFSKLSCRTLGVGGVVREDIMMWMLRK
ncbi:hypothetical protein RND81_08G145700 [Saponaria officinalis]|uniref:Uncharacterized protein n=1 Tax=Saponaria officinalis TaxID=3572 RepID=A0AAW1J8E4_SAPOF